ncbi:MAG: hypothetical protein FWD52_04595 [Candidatus Bathyarchaeota archaeon]|nr:hypothetical protein [Candidatus Termiticorpusculum sp.]
MSAPPCSPPSHDTRHGVEEQKRDLAAKMGLFQNFYYEKDLSSKQKDVLHDVISHLAQCVDRLSSVGWVSRNCGSCAKLSQMQGRRGEHCPGCGPELQYAEWKRTDYQGDKK